MIVNGTHKVLGKASLLLMAATASVALAQAPQQQQGTADPAAPATAAQDGSPAYATGKPLEMQSHEGFFGHLNPFARKKWVHRQIDPIKDRANELDELQAKNSNDIRDVDSRATAGVNRAMTAANAADAHAADASARAAKANSLAVSADGRTTSLNGTVSNLDQYQRVSSTALPFVAGHTTLTAKQKQNLDEVAGTLGAEKGYIVEVEGYSRGGISTSQAMADTVVRYLVTAHQIPIYRIYRTGLGKGAATTAANTEDKPISNGVRVTVLHNSLATMDGQTASNSGAPGLQ